MKTLLLFISVAACSEHGRTPDPWGVPITGGTMIVTRTNVAVVADADRDRVVSVDLATNKVIAEFALDPGSEPGRLAEDSAGRIHVATRRGGQLLTFASTALGEPARRNACNAPRGVAYEAANDRVHVACQGGELATFAPAGGQAIRVVHLDRDLRDIVVQGTDLLVSRFRSAELLTVDVNGLLTSRAAPPPVFRFRFGSGPLGGGPIDNGQVDAVANVAWRTVGLSDGTIVMSHQRHVRATLDGEQEGGYGGGCQNSPAEDAVTIKVPGQPLRAVARVGRGALPVDLAVSPTGNKLAFLVAGSGQVRVVDTTTVLAREDQDECGGGEEPLPPDEPPPPPRDDDDDDDQGEDNNNQRLGAPTSVGFAANGDVVIFYPELPGLVVRQGGGPLAHSIRFTGGGKSNPGRSVFHRQTRVGLACASCHPEGGDDAQTWSFRTLGQRRTQSLAGDILSRAPYHWAGDERNLSILMDDVFAVRMGGGPLTVAQKESLGPWLNTIPAPAPFKVNEVAAARGKEIFERADTACTACHNGSIFTNNAMTDVGKGGVFKVPSLLGVGSRPPFMHDGSASTLRERFGPAGGGDSHGRTSHLTEAQISDMIAYLESL
ncbi:MAG: cytochrome c [Deltaproteobacteria bacterium]|nr:cytochrome c [Deltaproteobacteria bacterium]MCW5804668.1 cytochrome c [Deltaproteobacteria bacterium]